MEENRWRIKFLVYFELVATRSIKTIQTLESTCTHHVRAPSRSAIDRRFRTGAGGGFHSERIRDLGEIGQDEIEDR